MDPKIAPFYPQARMINTFCIISKSFGARIEREFKENDVWQPSFSDIRMKIVEGMRICSKWKDCMTHLTRDRWKQRNLEH